MLLRRITEHVKNQNWFAVFIDFVIVVIGILIAFQITEWNEARAERQREIVLLERLHNDFEKITAWLDDAMVFVNSAPADTSWLIEQIRADRKPDLGAQFIRAAQASIYLRAISEQSATYLELVATGTLSKISNPELREALGNYDRSRVAERDVSSGLYAIQRNIDTRQAIQFKTMSTNLESLSNESLLSAVTPRFAEITTPISYDWEQLKKTEPYLHLLLQNHLYVQGWKQLCHSEAKKVFALLKKELQLPLNESSEVRQ